jgi:RND family efflux transporter MFP subunit
MTLLRKLLFAFVFLVVVGLLVFSGIAPRLRARQALRKETEASAAPAVTVFKPSRGVPSEEVVLPGNIQAFVDAPIYARTSGYLKRWYFDIGAHVKQGQLLAEIESPEVDQQLSQGREQVNTAKANLQLAQITATRYTDLFKTDSVAKQDVDNAVQTSAAREADVKSAQANVARLQQMVDFEKVYAPFNGVITARNTDTGQLIQSGSTQNRELFHIAAVDRLRVFVNVPQIYSHQTTPGMSADLTLQDMPGRRFSGKLVRTADSLDPATRTLLVEVDVPNNDGQLFPGAFTEVHFKVKTGSSTLIIPSTSLIFRSQGLRVPIVKNGKTELVTVTTGRDFGNTVEILSGLDPDADVVDNPPDAIVQGESVRVLTGKAAKHAGE